MDASSSSSPANLSLSQEPRVPSGSAGHTPFRTTSTGSDTEVSKGPGGKSARKGEKSRAFSVTINNYSEDEYDSFLNCSKATYVVAGKEEGESGTPHIQGEYNSDTSSIQQEGYDYDFGIDLDDSFWGKIIQEENLACQPTRPISLTIPPPPLNIEEIFSPPPLKKSKRVPLTPIKPGTSVIHNKGLDYYGSFLHPIDVDRDECHISTTVDSDDEEITIFGKPTFRSNFIDLTK
jgi:hypothetical protein